MGSIAAPLQRRGRMHNSTTGRVAIVDYGMGNLFSVKEACREVGLTAEITSSQQDILNADAVILPGVGAFGDAMNTLDKLDLASVLQEIAASSKPLVGICLGMQLLMTESHEFGRHRGLGIIEGEVLRLQVWADGARTLKVPQVGWNRIHEPDRADPDAGHGPNHIDWDETLLSGLPDGGYLYFVHSFYASPVDESVVTSITKYGPVEFCSSLQFGSVFACQFHPERSGLQGLKVYQNLARSLAGSKAEQSNE